jgi:hypothetical protein
MLSHRRPWQTAGTRDWESSMALVEKTGYLDIRAEITEVNQRGSSTVLRYTRKGMRHDGSFG